MHRTRCLHAPCPTDAPIWQVVINPKVVTHSTLPPCSPRHPLLSAAQNDGKKAGKKAGDAARQAGNVAKQAADNVSEAVRRAGEAAHSSAADATAQVATVFLAQGGERQGDSVPAEVAEATAARTRKED